MRPGYLAATLPVTVPTRGDVRRDFSLPVASGALRVVDVSHRWKENVYFLSGASQNVSLTATVDWGGLTPGTVLFSTPSGRTSVPATESRTTHNFDAGQLPACVGIKVQAQAVW